MKTQSLIPSFEAEELHSIDKAADNISIALSNEIQGIVNLANPLNCEAKYLSFLAYAFKVDFWDERLDENKKRALIQESIILHQRKGTLWAIERVLEILEVKADVSEWFDYGGEPYYFKVKLEIEKNFPHINQLAYLIDVYKNVRSKYEIDFDLFLDTVFEIKAATNTNIDINEKIVFEKEALFNVVFGCNFDYDPFDIFNVQSDLKLTADSKSIADVEFEEKEFDIERDTFFIPTTGSIARLDFGYTDSDVMHLPIPPIELKTLLVNSANIILDMNFDKAGNDLFHLDFTKEYQVIGGVSYVPVSIFEIDVSNSGIDKTINAKTDFDMVCKINLNI